MGFLSAAITTGNYTSLRRDNYRCIQYISLLPNTVIQTTTTSTTSSFGTSYAQLTLNATVSADVEIGHTVILSRTATFQQGMEIAGLYRVRKTPSGTTLYINESDTQILSGYTWYVHIIDDYRLSSKLGRVVGSTYYKDYDKTFNKPRPIINNLQSAYAGFIDSGTSNLTISFAPSVLLVASGATAVTWLWDVADGTITVGTTASQNITATFPEGFRWVTVSLTDSNGVAGWRRIPVWAHGNTTTPATGFTGANITGSYETGYNATIAGFEGIDDYIDNTLCVIWRREWYGSTEENIINNIDFIGRLRNERNAARGDEIHGVFVEDVDFVIEGVGQQLQGLPAPVISTSENSTPTIWDQIQNNTPGRTIAHILWEHSTFCELYGLWWETTSSPIGSAGQFGDAYRYPDFGTSQGDMLSTVNDIAYSCRNGAIEFAQDGAARLVSDSRISGVTTLAAASFTEQDAIYTELTIDHTQRYSKVDASGGIYNTTSGTITPKIFSAPGAIGLGGGQVGSLHRQIMPSNTTGAGGIGLYSAAHSYWRYVLNARHTLSVTLPDGYHWIIPSRNDRYQFNLSGDVTQRGYAIVSSSLYCTSITITQNNELGSRQVQAEFTGLIRTTADTEPDPPDYSNDSTEFVLETLAQQNGNIVCVWDTDNVWITTNFKETNAPTWHNITPADSSINPFLSGEGIVACSWSVDAPRLYMLTTEGTGTSGRFRVWYKENGFNLYEQWTPGAWKTVGVTMTAGSFRLVLRPTWEDQHLYVFTPTTNSFTAVAYFSSDSGQTWGTDRTFGTSAAGTPEYGFDVVRIGNAQLGCDNTDTYIATTENGTYASYSTANGVALFIPRYQFGGGTTSNINTSTPHFLVGGNSGTGLTKVTNSGGTFTGITPTNATDIYEPNAIFMPWVDSNKIVIHADNGSTTEYLATTTNGGSSWTETSGINFISTTQKGYVRMRRTDQYAREIYMLANVSASAKVIYSPDFGVTLTPKTSPTDAQNLKGIEVYG